MQCLEVSGAIRHIYGSLGVKGLKEVINISFTESLGLYELKQHKPWFDKECSQFSGKQPKKCSGYRIRTKARQIS